MSMSFVLSYRLGDIVGVSRVWKLQKQLKGEGSS